MKRRILILYTGGTIGMQPSEQGYVPVTGFHELLQQQLHSKTSQQLPEFELLELDQLIDSANLVPQHWLQIAGLLQQHWQQYDGFIVLHGTDTMAYTASALSFMLQGLDKPVILTGSQIPLVELRNDALDNLITALLLAGNYQIPEVCIYFNGRLLRGNRSTKLKSTGFDAFDSPNFPWLGQVGIHIELHGNLLLEPGLRQFLLPAFDAEAVVMLQLYPGIPARVVDALLDSPKVKGLILQSYGVGNVPDANEALVDSLAKASDRGVVVLNITQCLQGRVSQGAYATGSVLNRIGVVAGQDLTPEAAFAKLHFLLASGLTPEQVREQLAQPLCGESS
ncbi:asparaginase [Marinobacterium arenosum]|uniref:asparaginase n=1 Tax=Marinobacterium arenosum TaxID=2862496 RepID=UPI001C977E35|nr:asparaginase [Marinobacterium arenosum]MBY4677715.1 asparaginase [Marinobacterium arenosum]